MKKTCNKCKFYDFDYEYDSEGMIQPYNYCDLSYERVEPKNTCEFWNDIKKWKESRKV